MTESDELDELRTQMDDLNQQLVATLHRRAELARAIGRAKREAGLPPIDPDRELRMLQELSATTPDGGFARNALQQILDVVFERSRVLVENPDA